MLGHGTLEVEDVAARHPFPSGELLRGKERGEGGGERGKGGRETDRGREKQGARGRALEGQTGKEGQRGRGRDLGMEGRTKVRRQGWKP